VTDSRSRVAICIVTHNSGGYLAGCLESVAQLDYAPLSVILVDCASEDESLRIAREQAPPGLDMRIIPLTSNRGFAGGMNAALQANAMPYVLSLNPDARPSPDFVSRLVERLESHPERRVGAVAGRLVRPSGAGSRKLDACGMHLTLTWRHLDRGSGEADRGQLSAPEQVFGATGAASLFLRRALDDVAVEGAIFAEEFHSYREDAELAFRLGEREWEVLYEPRAVCEHRRLALPARRRALSAEINFHSLKNRYLLRAYHQRAGNFLLTLVPTLWRDLLALAYVLLAERTSLRAYSWLWAHRQSIRQRRRSLADRRTCHPRDIDRWFFRRGLRL
jgi:GT2 family glycosyltransferase